MARMRFACLVILYSALSGARANIEMANVFFSSGESVPLPCNNAPSSCTSTTWNMNRDSDTIELVNSGEIKKNTEYLKKLFLGSDCSLNIINATKEDRGSYSCRQYVNNDQYGNDARVFLHFLHVFSSQTEVRSGHSVNVYCQLFSYQVPCSSFKNNERIPMVWVDKSGNNLESDSRYQISISEYFCTLTLSTTLQDKDEGQEWRCVIILNNEAKTSATYKVKFSESPKIPVTTKESVVASSHEAPRHHNKPASHSTLPVDVFLSVLAILILAVMFAVVYRKCRDKSGTTNSRVTDEECNRTYETINISIPPTTDSSAQKDAVIYKEVVTYSKLQAYKVQDYEKVTYSTVKGKKYEAGGDITQLYATVNKNTH